MSVETLAAVAASWKAKGRDEGFANASISVDSGTLIPRFERGQDERVGLSVLRVGLKQMIMRASVPELPLKPLCERFVKAGERRTSRPRSTP